MDTPEPLKPVSGPPRRAKRDLVVRSLSAIVMLAIAVAALIAGGWAFTILVLVVAVGVFAEYRGLVRRMLLSGSKPIFWFLFGLFYIGGAAAVLVFMRGLAGGFELLLVLFGIVWATDIGAYFVGRLVGGPKLAPRISPAKTWSGLLGGMIAASVAAMIAANHVFLPWNNPYMPLIAACGAFLAVIAQFGDLFESWMKRKANVKDSGRLIPGHGGLFDRVDGLLPVVLVGYVLTLGLQVFADGL